MSTEEFKPFVGISLLKEGRIFPTKVQVSGWPAYVVEIKSISLESEKSTGCKRSQLFSTTQVSVWLLPRLK